MVQDIRLDDPRVTLPQILAGSEQVVQRLRTLSASAGPRASAALFYTRSRAKALESVTGKVGHRRRVKDDADYSFRRMTDFAGFRIVTLNDDDLIKAIDYILAIIKAGQTVSDPIFAPGNVFSQFHDAKFSARTELPFDGALLVEKQTDIYYKCMRHFLDRLESESRLQESLIDDADPEAATRKAEISATRNYVRAECTALPKKRDRYSSAHLTFWALSYHQNFPIPIPVEFQIRTAIEDVWAEVSHKLLYKSKSEFVWSLEYERDLNLAEQQLGSIKTRMDNLPSDIAAIYTHSNQAQILSLDFWGDKGLAPERNTDLHFSLCTALIGLVGDGKLLQEWIKVPLETYKKRVVDLNPKKNSDLETASILGECVKLLAGLAQQIESRYLNLTEQSMDDHGEYVDQTSRLYEQRKLLVDLEILRLKGLLALNYSHRFDSGAVIPFKDSAEKKEICTQLYGQLCGFVDTKRLKIKPITMLHTWKYLLASAAFKNDQVARMNLNLASAAMIADPTLPGWSIYRVLIPAYLGVERQKEVEGILTDLNSSSVPLKRMPYVSSELKDKLADAVRFAADAFEEHIDSRDHKSDRRGDILFEADFIRPISQAQLALSITRMLNDRLGVFVGKINPSICARIDRIIKYVENRREEFEFLKEDARSTIDADLVEVKNLLLANHKLTMTVAPITFNQLMDEDFVQPAQLKAEVAASLRRLPEGLDRYFIRTPNSREFDLHSLVATRARDKGVSNANELMILASEGKTAKREPIKVRPLGSQFVVVDGNSTFVNAVFSGWPVILGELEQSDTPS
jgi:ppGpp synthetase/RelA/SpoT-type nucleotidyltranferase